MKIKKSSKSREAALADRDRLLGYVNAIEGNPVLRSVFDLWQQSARFKKELTALVENTQHRLEAQTQGSK